MAGYDVHSKTAYPRYVTHLSTNRALDGVDAYDGDDDDDDDDDAGELVRAFYYCQHCHYDAYDVRMIKRCTCKPGPSA